VVGLLRGRPSIKDEDTQYILLHAEHLTEMLAHLHAARLLADQAGRHPERLPLALRQMQRAVRVTAQDAAAIKSGDRSTLAALAQWQEASS
jgi:hypothetical protein